VIDPHVPYPEDFRSEKLDASQVKLLHKAGLAKMLRAGTPLAEIWIARFGRLVERRRAGHYGISYSTLVNAVRAEISPPCDFIPSKVTAISCSAARQRVSLANGDEINARLIVLATGLNNGLRHTLGVTRADVSLGHSLAIGFDLSPPGRAHFDFPALTYHAERTAARLAYLSVFPIGSRMRANLFGYRGPGDPWLRQLREDPQKALFAAMPGLERWIGPFAVRSEIRIRPVDLYVTRGFRQPGLVLVGDAFGTSCPAAGTGVSKVLTDVERLCNVHVPRWLATDGMSVEKTGDFYDDPVKDACDASSAALAYYVRDISLNDGLPWRLRRNAKFVGQLAWGSFQQAREHAGMGAGDAQNPAPTGVGP
jgi:2-polyprenyl-6-methoxyphenol hydroxylase-like FAD-dependent oxidoreductase